MLILAVLVAWGTLFIPMPRWLSWIVTFLICGIGILLVLGGGFSYWWDSNMQPSITSGKWEFIAGIAMLLSRGVQLFSLLFEIGKASL
jgi:hypothetical protein